MDKAGEVVKGLPTNSNGSNIPNYNITKFKLNRILNNNTVRKSIALLGTFPDVSSEDLAVVFFEKQAFTSSDLETENGVIESSDDKDDALNNADKSIKHFFNEEMKIKTEFINDIYGNFNCVPSADINGLKTTVVYPATDKHIEKYSIRPKYLINETPALYENLTLPYINSRQFSLEWVFNILEHKQETERIAYEDPDPTYGFILLPDLKWDGHNLDTLYLLAISHQRGIKSLRDLTAQQLPLLRNVRDKCAAEIERKYSIARSQLRMYIHYQPSFYHLHVHINLLRNDAPGIWCEKSHILDTVINNIEVMPDYYKKCTLPFVLFEGDRLLEEYEREMNIKVKCVRTEEKTDEGTSV